MNRTGLCLTVLPQLPHLRGGGHRDSTWPRLTGRPQGRRAGGRQSQCVGTANPSRPRQRYRFAVIISVQGDRILKRFLITLKKKI